MGTYACEYGLGVTLWTGNCEVGRFLRGGNARELHVLRLMLTDAWRF